MTIQWKQSRLHGGGFITGLVQSKKNPDILYARADVAGVFKSDNRGLSWMAINQGMTDCHQHDVRSIAVSPHNPDILFRCSGSVRDSHFFGTIHKSADAGLSWRTVCT
ncbi:MAG: hypothetical protein AAFV93_23830, partial [Chloroflexota bacterium]